MHYLDDFILLAESKDEKCTTFSELGIPIEPSKLNAWHSLIGIEVNTVVLQLHLPLGEAAVSIHSKSVINN